MDKSVSKERSIMRTRIVLVALAALLALPAAPLASPVVAKGRARTVTRTFTNAAAIDLPLAQTGPVSGSVYPSAIEVSGLKKAGILDVNVRLDNYTHANGADVDVLLVGPGGQTAIVMSRVGEETSGNAAVTLRFDDEAATALPDEDVLGGTFRPTNQDGVAIDFKDPAPDASANAALSVFDGGNPNGTWRLFVQDAFPTANSGALAGGWTLELTATVKGKKKRR
jgi:subtilisin-like proprotein convertase family protein